MSTELRIPTSRGEARALVDEPTGGAGERSAPPTILLGHGAGGGAQAPDLVHLAEALPGRGLRVVRIEQPWRVAGRRVAPAPSILDDAWTQVLGELKDTLELDVFAVGGRSAGARVACRTGAALGARAVLALAFPLHPPGRPERSRAEELTGAALPVLVLQGERDPFGRPEEFPVVAGLTVQPVPGDHSLRAAAAALARPAAEFLCASLGPGA